MIRRWPLALASLATVLLLASTSRAEPDDAARARAKEAYARGVRAHEAGDYKGAAAAFAEADALAPSPVALMAALDAAVEADDPVLGAELLDRSARASPTPALATSIEAARGKLGGRAGRVRVACPATATCTTTIDGRAAEGPTWVTPGRHAVVVRIDGEPREHAVDVRAGETFVVSPMAVTPPSPTAPERPAPAPVQAAAPAPSAPAHARSGLPPFVFFVGAAVTVGLGAGAAVTGLLAKSKYDDFLARRCDQGPGPECATLQERGEPLVIATNLLLAGAAVTAVATTVIAVAFTDWDRGSSAARARSRRLIAAPLPSGGAMGGLSIDF